MCVFLNFVCIRLAHSSCNLNLQGAYVVTGPAVGEPVDAIIITTGSEVMLAVEAAKMSGLRVRRCERLA